MGPTYILPRALFYAANRLWAQINAKTMPRQREDDAQINARTKVLGLLLSIGAMMLNQWQWAERYGPSGMDPCTAETAVDHQQLHQPEDQVVAYKQSRVGHDDAKKRRPMTGCCG